MTLSVTTPSVFQCPEGVTKYQNVGELKWREAKRDDSVTSPCPEGGIATRKCVHHGWLEPDIAECHSKVTKEINEIVKGLPNKVIQICKHFAILVTQINGFVNILSIQGGHIQENS